MIVNVSQMMPAAIADFCSPLMLIFEFSLFKLANNSQIFIPSKAFMNARNTITIRHHVYDRLKSHGVFGESFSKLLTRILDELEGDRRNR